MPKKNNTPFKHLSFDNRKDIEQRIGRESIRSIASYLGVDSSTVSREVRRNRVRDKSYRYGHGVTRFCANHRHCQVKGLCKGCSSKLCRVCRKSMCTHHCPHYLKAHCDRLDAAPHVCNGCSKKIHCSVERWIYDARQADTLARLRLSEERSGFDLTSLEIKEVAELIVPLIKAGQTIGQIYLNHPEEIPFSQRSLRTYIHAGVFAELSDFDLKRKVRYKARKKNNACVPRHIPDRSYSDFALLSSDMQARTVELDTVMGSKGSSKCLLTLFLRSCSLMPIFLLDNCDSECVWNAFHIFFECISISTDDLCFWEVVPILLPDRGSEFSDYESLEVFGIEDGVAHTHLYYCDARHPEQRGGQEKNHTYIREILPKGTSFDELDQDDICLLSSHINSIPRASLGGKTPYELASFLYGKSWLDNLGITYIAPDEVIRKPLLLDKIKIS